jgi:cyclohexanone monooxygenase
VTTERVPPEGAVRYDAVVVGAGIAGLYLLHRLRALGLAVLVVDQADGIGGTWYWNRYPGARCDIESLTYSYSWSPELEDEWVWTERYATQPEILAYLEHVADRFDLWRDIRLGTRVVGARFLAGEHGWLLETAAGDHAVASFLVMATGCLSVPRIPEIEGLERFAGPVHHTGLWPREGLPLAGKRVAVIGTGSSAVQLITTIAHEAAEVIVFQRTANFSVPAWNAPLDREAGARLRAGPVDARAVARTSSAGEPWNARDQSVWDATPEEREAEFEERYRVGGFYLHAAYNDLFDDPAANDLLSEFVRRKIRERVGDDAIAELLCPYDHFLGTKRMLVDTGYFETFRQRNVRLVSIRDQPIDEVTEHGVRVGTDEHPCDVIVLGTGFDAITGALLALDPVGRDGISLRERWAEGYESYLGLAVSGFPNLFCVTGPGSPSVLSNMMVSIEQHVEWISACLAYLRANDVSVIEASREAEAAWMEHVRELGDASLFPRTRSWYMGRNVPGKPQVLLPYVGGVGVYRERCDAVAAGGYEGFLLATPEGPGPSGVRADS